MSEAVLAALRQTAIRFTDDQRKLILRARSYRGQTFQTFAHAAVMKEVRATLEEMDALKMARVKLREERQERRRTVGLGIRERALEESAALEAPEPAPIAAAPPLAPQPVIVQVQTTSAPDLAAIAQVIVASPRSDRRRLLEKACQELSAGRSLEESLRLSDQLDAEIKRVQTQPTSVLERVRARRGAR